MEHWKRFLYCNCLRRKPFVHKAHSVHLSQILAHFISHPQPQRRGVAVLPALASTIDLSSHRHNLQSKASSPLVKSGSLLAPCHKCMAWCRRSARTGVHGRSIVPLLSSPVDNGLALVTTGSPRVACHRHTVWCHRDTRVDVHGRSVPLPPPSPVDDGLAFGDERVAACVVLVMHGVVSPSADVHNRSATPPPTSPVDGSLAFGDERTATCGVP